MRLARARLTAHDDAQGCRDRVADGVAEGVHDVVDGVFVEAGNVRRRLGLP